MKPRLLIVDDDEDIRSQMKWALVQDYDVSLAEDRASALLKYQEHHPIAVLLDLGLPPNPADSMEGFKTLNDILALDGRAKIIMITGQSEKNNALQAIGHGAYDFLCKPVDMAELIVILKRAIHVAQLEKDYYAMEQRLGPDSFEGMLGAGPLMQEVFAQIRKVATTDAPVLILGESGTGKEMAAQAIHRSSPRKNGPFVAINCGAIPEHLLESELFGHEKGSFTGAHVQRCGRIETAAGGTLFLDEIGELPSQLQVKILRYLQELYVERVGGREKIPVDARVIAATNADLKRAMQEGKFREDLFYRLAVVVFKLPPLRDRKNDVLLLAQSFLQTFAAQNKKENQKFSQDALRAIQSYHWPGNVRELENRIKRAVIMSEGKWVTAANLELTDSTETNAVRSLKEAREGLESTMIRQALRRNNGNISKAASELGISRPTLYEMIDKLGISKE